MSKRFSFVRGDFTMKLPVGIAFALEPLTVELISELMPLLAQHWTEVAHFNDIPLNPDLSYYLASQSAGFIRCYTLRAGGSLRGYAVFFLRRNPHYITSLQASQDILYIDPSLRGRIPLAFIDYCDNQLQLEGVQAVYHHVKAAHNFGLILQRKGYELVDLIYTKRLDKER